MKRKLPDIGPEHLGVDFSAKGMTVIPYQEESVGSAVLTATQGQALVGPRMQLILDNFDAAVAHLHTCTEFTGIAGWASAAEAAGFWGKMRQDERAMQAARDFRAHCYREYGKLAIKERGLRGRTKGGVGGSTPAGHKWLMNQGMTRNEAAGAIRMGKMSTEAFNTFVTSARSPLTNALVPTNTLSHALSAVLAMSRVQTSTGAAAAVIESRNHKNLRENTLKRLRECIEWLTAVESELLRLTSIQ